MPLIQGQVQGSLPSASLSGTTNNFGQGKLSELLVSQVHGRLGLLASAGNLFIASTAAAGVTIPVSSATAPTFTLYNPAGSAINAELLWINIGITVVTSVASPLLLGYTSGITAGTAPSSTTARAISNAKLGAGNAAICQLYTAATITAVTTFFTIGQVTATNATAGNSLGPSFATDLMGGIVLTPGSFVHVCGTAAQTSATTISLLYAEYPV